MKKFVCIMLCLAFALCGAACNKKKKSVPARLWCIQPASVTAEEELKRFVRVFDADAHVSFVPESELDMRLKDAIERDEAPDVFMVFADALPDLAEEKDIVDLSGRLPTSRVETEKLPESTRKACLYQGKTWAVPLFVDAYFLAVNRALVPTPPDSLEQLSAQIDTLSEKGVSVFSKLTPQKQSILYEAILEAQDGNMLNARKTKLAFTDETGEKALTTCTELLKDSADTADAIGAGKAAFSVMTTAERRAMSEKFPDAEIELSPLLGYNRLQTVAIALSDESENKKQAFKLLEFLQENSEKIAALYKTYAATKDLQPLTEDDKDAVVQIAEARPAPDLCGYATLESTYLPAAIDKAGKGVPAADALKEAEKQASGVIWKGKRE